MRLVLACSQSAVPDLRFRVCKADSFDHVKCLALKGIHGVHGWG